MSQFYGDIKGGRGITTRAGTKKSGLTSHIRGWNIGVKVHCWYDEVASKDVISVYETGGSHEQTVPRLITTLVDK